MAKLSILIDDQQLKALKQLALNRDAKFQEMVRGVVLSLLGNVQNGQSGTSCDVVPGSAMDPKLIQSLHTLASKTAEAAKAAASLASEYEARTGHAEDFANDAIDEANAAADEVDELLGPPSRRQGAATGGGKPADTRTGTGNGRKMARGPE